MNVASLTAPCASALHPAAWFSFPAQSGAPVAGRLVSYKELRQAGWSKGMVVKFLGGCGRAFPIDEVEAAEASPRFRAAWYKAFRIRCGVRA